ncbi:MAG: response regulator receiver protein [Dehalococcoidia bacterium]|nr:response regulator receiver protein [Dehalococcoidia bacterium]
MVKKILLADDEEGVLELLSATLGNDKRYVLFLARDGEEALRIARREKPDLLFLDVVMPKMNGYQMCQALKEDPATAQTRVIMLTALAQQAHRQRAMEAGADDYFTKPFSPTALLNVVENLVTMGTLESYSPLP